MIIVPVFWKYIWNTIVIISKLDSLSPYISTTCFGKTAEFPDPMMCYYNPSAFGMFYIPMP